MSDDPAVMTTVDDDLVVNELFLKLRHLLRPPLLLLTPTHPSRIATVVALSIPASSTATIATKIVTKMLTCDL